MSCDASVGMDSDTISFGIGVCSIRSRCCSLEMICAGIKRLLLRFFYSITRILMNSKTYENHSIYLILS